MAGLQGESNRLQAELLASEMARALSNSLCAAGPEDVTLSLAMAMASAQHGLAAGKLRERLEGWEERERREAAAAVAEQRCGACGQGRGMGTGFQGLRVLRGLGGCRGAGALPEVGKLFGGGAGDGGEWRGGSQRWSGTFPLALGLLFCLQSWADQTREVWCHGWQPAMGGCRAAVRVVCQVPWHSRVTA